MSFQCQKNSYLREFKTKVVSCEPSKVKIVTNGKKEQVAGFDVICEDTVLFPEGGGQPDDRGTMNGIEVLRITRNGDRAVHFIKEPIEPGTEVTQVVDWTRRFDLMQQHSAQHLISAIADEKYGWKTTTWDLGREKTFIEMDTPAIKPGEMQQLEKDLNEAIKKCLPMTPRWVESDSEEAKQSIKLTTTETARKKRTNLYFVAGDRVLSYLGQMVETERKLNKSLKCGPSEFAEAVDRQQKALRATNKANTLLLREIAALEAKCYLKTPDRDPVFCLHRKDGDTEFLNMVANGIGAENALMLVSVGDEGGAGLFLVAGPEAIVSAVWPSIQTELKAKGVYKNGRYQGKATLLANRDKAEAILREHASELKRED